MQGATAGDLSLAAKKPPPSPLSIHVPYTALKVSEPDTVTPDGSLWYLK